MSSAPAFTFPLSPEQDKNIAAFLVGLDGYLSLDLSRQALCRAFHYDERQAKHILYDFRDRNVLLWTKLSSGEMRWFYVAALVDALVGIGWMPNLVDDQNRRSSTAIQTVIRCSDQEAARILKFLEKDPNAVIQRLSNYSGPGFETHSQWRWERVATKANAHEQNSRRATLPRS